MKLIIHYIPKPNKSEGKTVEFEKVRRQNEELQKRISQQEARNQGLLEEMRACVKHFYPTSWKSSESYSHRNIESWDHETLSRNSKVTFSEFQESLWYKRKAYLVKSL